MKAGVKTPTAIRTRSNLLRVNRFFGDITLSSLCFLVDRESRPRCVRGKQFAPRPDGPLTHFVSPRGEKCRLMPNGPPW